MELPIASPQFIHGFLWDFPVVISHPLIKDLQNLQQCRSGGPASGDLNFDQEIREGKGRILRDSTTARNKRCVQTCALPQGLISDILSDIQATWIG